jgi:hypothetical protein
MSLLRPILYTFLLAIRILIVSTPSVENVVSISQTCFSNCHNFYFLQVGVVSYRLSCFVSYRSHRSHHGIVIPQRHPTAASPLLHDSLPSFPSSCQMGLLDPVDVQEEEEEEEEGDEKNSTNCIRTKSSSWIPGCASPSLVGEWEQLCPHWACTFGNPRSGL